MEDYVLGAFVTGDFVMGDFDPIPFSQFYTLRYDISNFGLYLVCFLRSKCI